RPAYGALRAAAASPGANRDRQRRSDRIPDRSAAGAGSNSGRGQDGMNAYEFFLALFVLMGVFTVIRHRLGIPVRSMRQMRGEPANDEENERLRGQVKQLQNRINVLERIVTDRGVETAAQIEALREH